MVGPLSWSTMYVSYPGLTHLGRGTVGEPLRALPHSWTNGELLQGWATAMGFAHLDWPLVLFLTDMPSQVGHHAWMPEVGPP